MKLKLNYINKRNKLDKENHLIFVNSKIIRKFDKKIDLKIVLENDLFKEKKFLQKNFDNKNYVFINCIDCKKILDFEKIGSSLFEFLSNNKVFKSVIDTKLLKISTSQVERILHGAKLKSYNFDIYKTNKNKKIININFVGGKKSSNLRKKLDALTEGIFSTRDLVSEPGNILHPDEYAKRVSALKKLGLKVTVYDKRN